jgi:eukaryotic-like serine/threonine-protein kinase
MTIMDPERWQRLKRVYDAALEQEPARREAYLAQACADDQSLLRELRSLLAQKTDTQVPLDSPAMQLAARALAGDTDASPRPDLCGTRILHYRIEKRIGEGGMGVVYRALDERLNRTVAVKVLPPHYSNNPDMRQRFDREARAISALNHPDICTLHDIGHHDGLDFLVMEFLDGETLADRLRARPPQLHEAIRIAAHVAGGRGPGMPERVQAVRGVEDGLVRRPGKLT